MIIIIIIIIIITTTIYLLGFHVQSKMVHLPNYTIKKESLFY